MKNIVLISFMFIVSICTAQKNIEAYSFIEVPDRFEFLSGDNPYQLSDMLVFYLKKKEMKAYREIDSPDVFKCDVLYADLEKGKSVLYTRLVLVLKDCNNRVVFKSGEGKSKVKEYAKAYPDALRMTFKTFTKDDVNISELKDVPVAIEQEQEKTTKDVIVAIDDKLNEDKVTNAKVPKASTTISKIPQASFSNYTLNGQSYLLKKVTSGYTLFLTQEGNDNFVKVGDITLDKNANFKMRDIYGESKSGYFDQKQDLVIKLASGSELMYTKEH